MPTPEALPRERGLLALFPFVPVNMLAPLILRAVEERGMAVHIAVQSPAAGSYRMDHLTDFDSAGRLLKLWTFPHHLWIDAISSYITDHNIGSILMVGAFDLYSVVPHLKERHSDLNIADILYNPIGHTTNHFLYERAFNDVLVESIYMKSIVLRSTGIGDRRTHVMPSGVDLDRFMPRARLHGDSLTIGYVGRFAQEKNPLGFLDMVDSLSACIPGLAFKMFGSGPQEADVRARIARLAEPSRFQFVGFIDDVVDAYAQIDLLAVPSSDDGRPVAIMEANACGVPVLAAAVGGIPEMVSEGENGHLIGPRETDRAVEILSGLVSDRGALKRLCSTTRRFAEGNFGMRTMIDAYEATLRELVSTGGTGPR